MKKIAVFLYVIALLFSFSSCKENNTPDETKVITKADISPNYTHGVYEVEITATNVYNNSVGRSWQKVYTCDGKEIHSGERWILPLDTTKTVTIGATLTEQDMWPDVGTGSLSVVMSDDFETSTAVEVTENKGRYKGNQAEWKVFCKVKLVEKIP